MEFYCFGSGSRGNAFLVRAGRTVVLIDAGLPPHTLRAALHRCGIQDDDLTAIIISHEHSDHVQGLKRLLSWHSCPVWATEGTHVALDLDGSRKAILEPERPLEIGPLRIEPVPVSHDANEPVGFLLSTGHATVALFTDLGLVTRRILQALTLADLVVLEANHDRAMLLMGPYPEWLKRRITSPFGHLSNDAAAEALAQIPLRPRTIWLAHLSQENNRPHLAIETVQRSVPPLSLSGLMALPQRGRLVRWTAESS